MTEAERGLDIPANLNPPAIAPVVTAMVISLVAYRWSLMHASVSFTCIVKTLAPLFTILFSFAVEGQPTTAARCASVPLPPPRLTPSLRASPLHTGPAHGLAADGFPFFAGQDQISRPMSGRQGARNARANFFRSLRTIQRGLKQHGHTENRSQRVGQSLPGDIGRRPVHRLIEAKAPSCQTGRRQHSQ